MPGSGGKDSIYASHILKYKYKMNPLTVTWSPHIYTDIGKKILIIGYIMVDLIIFFIHQIQKFKVELQEKR